MAAKHAPGRAKLPLHWKMLIGFAAGLLLGLVVHATAGAEAGWVQWITHHLTNPAGELFLRLIFMLVIPLLFSALVAGVGDMGDIGAFGRIGWRALDAKVLRHALTAGGFHSCRFARQGDGSRAEPCRGCRAGAALRGVSQPATNRCVCMATLR